MAISDNGNNGIFNTFVPTVDLYQDNPLVNRWLQQDATIAQNPYQVRYGTPGKNSNKYFPFSTLPVAKYLWRVMPDANGYYTFTNEAATGVMLSNQNNLANVELSRPNNMWWSVRDKQRREGTEFGRTKQPCLLSQVNDLVNLE